MAVNPRWSGQAAGNNLGAGLNERDVDVEDVEEGEEKADADDADEQVGQRPDGDAILTGNDGSSTASRL